MEQYVPAVSVDRYLTGYLLETQGHNDGRWLGGITTARRSSIGDYRPVDVLVGRWGRPLVASGNDPQEAVSGTCTVDVYRDGGRGPDVEMRARLPIRVPTDARVAALASWSGVLIDEPELAFLGGPDFLAKPPAHEVDHRVGVENAARRRRELGYVNDVVGELGRLVRRTVLDKTDRTEPRVELTRDKACLGFEALALKAVNGFVVKGTCQDGKTVLIVEGGESIEVIRGERPRVGYDPVSNVYHDTAGYDSIVAGLFLDGKSRLILPSGNNSQRS